MLGFGIGLFATNITMLPFFINPEYAVGGGTGVKNLLTGLSAACALAAGTGAILLLAGAYPVEVPAPPPRPWVALKIAPTHMALSGAF